MRGVTRVADKIKLVIFSQCIQAINEKFLEIKHVIEKDNGDNITRLINITSALIQQSQEFIEIDDTYLANFRQIVANIHELAVRVNRAIGNIITKEAALVMVAEFNGRISTSMNAMRLIENAQHKQQMRQHIITAIQLLRDVAASLTRLVNDTDKIDRDTLKFTDIFFHLINAENVINTHQGVILTPSHELNRDAVTLLYYYINAYDNAFYRFYETFNSHHRYFYVIIILNNLLKDARKKMTGINTLISNMHNRITNSMRDQQPIININDDFILIAHALDEFVIATAILKRAIDHRHETTTSYIVPSQFQFDEHEKVDSDVPIPEDSNSAVRTKLRKLISASDNTFERFFHL